MTTPKQGAAAAGEGERLSLDEFRRLVDEARDEPERVTELIRRLVLSTIDEVTESLERREADESGPGGDPGP